MRKYIVFSPQPTFGRGSGWCGSAEQAASLAEGKASPSTKFSVNAPNLAGKSRNKSLRAKSSPSFDSRSRDGFLRAKLRSCLIPHFTGLCVESSRVEFCDEDVVDDGAELDLEASLETPGTTMGVAWNSCAILTNCGF